MTPTTVPTALAPPTGTPKLYAQDGQGYSATVWAHYFITSCDWLVTEYDPDEKLAFGWACLNGDRQNAELGYVSLAELAEVRVLGFLAVEQDAHWPPGLTLTEAIALLDQRAGRVGG